MKTTQNYNMNLPEGSDTVDIKVLNENFETLDAELGAIRKVIDITLTTAGWTGETAPYIQTVSNSAVQADRDYELVSRLADGASESMQKDYNKAFALVSAGTGTTADGSVTFKVYKKPATNIVVGLKGV